MFVVSYLKSMSLFQLQSEKFHSQSLEFSNGTVSWHRPVSLEELLVLRQKHPASKLIVGNTEIGQGSMPYYSFHLSLAFCFGCSLHYFSTGVEVKFKNMVYPVLIAATHVPELCTIRKNKDGIEFGGSMTLNQMHDVLKESVEQLPGKDSYIHIFNLPLHWLHFLKIFLTHSRTSDQSFPEYSGDATLVCRAASTKCSSKYCL